MVRRGTSRIMRSGFVGSNPTRSVWLASLTAGDVMTKEYRTPYADDALDVENGTQPEELQDFVERRALNPIKIEGLIVWNFNNHIVDEQALREQSRNFLNDEFVIPYQASGAWGYMVTLLPTRIREAEILTYSQSRGRYNPYPNFIRHSEDATNENIRRRLTERLQEGSI